MQRAKKKKEKLQRFKKLKQRRMENYATCVDCQQPMSVREHLYIVRGEVWRAAAMERWDSGCLHEACLEKRLGRKLTKDDYLVRVVKELSKGGYRCACHPDYLTSPEFLLHSGPHSSN
jgi:hypothetical protein